MAIDALNELDRKVDNLINAFKTLKEESGKLREELEEKNRHSSELELLNQSLSGELSSLKGALDERQKKLDAAAERIQEILRRLESVGQA